LRSDICLIAPTNGSIFQLRLASAAMKIPPAWKPAAVVFDCDGLLVDTETCWAVAETEIFARAGLSFGPEQKALLIGKSVADEAREIAQAVGGGRNARDIELELLELASQAVGLGAVAMPGALSIVDRIGRMLPIAVASKSPRRLLAMTGSGASAGVAAHFRL
jgi:beta-phosphoglucomutase-like phosphatase (HAD superfamily)